MATREPKTTETESSIQLLSTTKCSSLNGNSEIRYSIGIDDKQEIWLKVISSSGGGQIHPAWFRFADIQKQLEKHAGGDGFTSTILTPVFSDVSANMAPFTMAVALHEKLVMLQEGKRRKYVHRSADAFLAKVEKLKASKSVKKAPRRKAKTAA
jgi:hypothetical protein